MTGLTKFVSKDMDVLFDAINKYSVGMDDTINRLHAFGLNPQGTSYPPYNIIKESDTEWKIEMALAGWNKKDVEVSTERRQLLIKSTKDQAVDEQGEYTFKGLAARAFSRSFNLSEDVEVTNVAFHNGLLTVTLTRVLPEGQQRRVYDIV
tara:strand:- start:298 stop:747 length:450 start_codon:yes stop_codon:yes gene_type:complete